MAGVVGHDVGLVVDYADIMMASLLTLDQRIYISDRTHSTPARFPNMCLIQPLPALSDSQVVGVVYLGVL